MKDDEFRRGLLLGLCASGQESFVSHGPKFEAAFRATLERASNSGIVEIRNLAKRMLEDFDPVFGVNKNASDMILDGMNAFIVTLDAPAMVRARFKIAADEASMLLLGSPWVAEMFSLGKKMKQAISDSHVDRCREE